MEGEQALGDVQPPFSVCVSGSLRFDFRGCLLRILPPLPSAPPRNLPAEPQQTWPVHRVQTLESLNRNAPGTHQHLLRGGDFARRPERPGLLSHVPALFHAVVSPLLPAAAAAGSSGCLPLRKDQACGHSSFPSSHPDPHVDDESTRHRGSTCRLARQPLDHSA